MTQYPMHPDPMRPATIEVTQRIGVPLRWVVTIAAILVVGAGVAATFVVLPRTSRHEAAAVRRQPGPAA